jgi:hypothetical protein
MFKKLKSKIYENKFQKKVGKQTLENITKILYEEFTKKIVDKGMSKQEFEDYECDSENWEKFLDTTQLELMYDIIPIIKNGRVADIKVEILEV